MSKVIRPRTHCTTRTRRWLSVAVSPAGGMKSRTWPSPSAVKKRVTRTAVSGRYICLAVYAASAGRIRKCPPRSSSSSAPNTLGESKRGQQNQSTEPSVVIRAAVCRSPMIPWSAMAVSVMALPSAVRRRRDGARPAKATLAGRRASSPHPRWVMRPVRWGDDAGRLSAGCIHAHVRAGGTAMRRFVSGLLIVISALSLILASTSLWTRRNVINTTVFVSNVETIVDLPQVEARINDRVTATVMTNPDVQDAIDQAVAVLPPRLQSFRPTVEDGIRSIVSAGVARILHNDPFRPLTAAAVTSAHDQLGNREPVKFTLGQAKNLVPASARSGLAGQVLGLIPNDLGVTLLTPSDAPQVYNAINLLKSIWLWMGLVAVGTLAGALGVSRHRRGTLRAWSVTTLVLALLVLATLRIARGRGGVAAKPDNRDAVGAVYDVLAGSLRSWTIWLVVFTSLVLVLTLTWGRLGVVAGVRRGMRSARDQIQRRREAHAAATAPATGVDGVAVPAVEESWGRRVAANTRAFADGLGLSDRATVLGTFVRVNLGPARWTGISVGAVVLLFWPAPTLRVLIWIVAFIALYLGALEWLLNRAPEEAAGPPTAEGVAPA